MGKVRLRPDGVGVDQQHGEELLFAFFSSIQVFPPAGTHGLSPR